MNRILRRTLRCPTRDGGLPKAWTTRAAYTSTQLTINCNYRPWFFLISTLHNWFPYLLTPFRVCHRALVVVVVDFSHSVWCSYLISSSSGAANFGDDYAYHITIASSPWRPRSTSVQRRGACWVVSWPVVHWVTTPGTCCSQPGRSVTGRHRWLFLQNPGWRQDRVTAGGYFTHTYYVHITCGRGWVVVTASSSWCSRWRFRLPAISLSCHNSGQIVYKRPSPSCHTV